VLVGNGVFEEPISKNAKAFLQSAIEGRESDAIAQTSPNFRDKVHQQCPDGLVTKCIDNLIPPSWGKFTGIEDGVYYPDGTILLYTYWSNNLYIPVVILEERQNGVWLIRGWRGFTSTDGENKDGQLLNGLSHENEFLSSQ
jgi:hypothetical protein